MNKGVLLDKYNVICCTILKYYHVRWLFHNVGLNALLGRMPPVLVGGRMQEEIWNGKYL